jgi:hypothetical protein
MKIDLNGPFTTADVADLLASKDDSQHRQVRVTSAGIAYLSDDVGNANVQNLAFRLETFNAGNDYTGERAAADQALVGRIERVLRANWPNPSSSYIDRF